MLQLHPDISNRDHGTQHPGSVFYQTEKAFTKESEIENPARIRPFRTGLDWLWAPLSTAHRVEGVSRADKRIMFEATWVQYQLCDQCPLALSP